MSFLAHIADRVLNQPLLLQPEKAAIIMEVLGGRIGVDAAQMSQFEGSPIAIGADGQARMMPFRVKDGVGIISVLGSLVNRGAWLGAKSGMTSYEGLQHQLKAARDSGDVRAVLLDFQSGGGEVTGAFETAQLIAEVAAQKRVVAVVNGVAASAAYLLASHASEIVTTDTGISGSIGVVYMHADMSKRLAEQGVTPTLIYAGAHKVDGNPYGPLPESVRADIQAQVDAIYSKFVDAVGAARGARFAADMARATEARVFTGAEAVKIGLADRIGTFETALEGLTRAPGRTPSAAKGQRMSGNNGAPTADTAGITQAQLDAAVASAAAQATADAERRFAAERERLNGLDDLARRINGHVAGTAIINAARTSGASVEATSLQLVQADAFAGAAVLRAFGADDASAAGAMPAAAPAVSQMGRDVRERFREGASRALMAKVGLDGGERNEFSGLTLAELARESLLTAGVREARLMPRMDMIGSAFTASGFGMMGGAHTTSDFAWILQNVLNKSVLKGYVEADETFELWTSKGQASDFKPSTRVDLGLFPTLDRIEEGSEFKYGTVGDRGTTVVIATYGKLVSVSRQTVINDDLNVLGNLPVKMGRAAKRTVGNLAYAVLTSNPTMADGFALFSSQHANLAGSGAAPSEATLQAGWNAMAAQKDADSAAVALNIRPRYALSGAYEFTLKQLMMSTGSLTDQKNAGVVNTVQGLVTPVTDRRITGNQWFLAADPNQFDTVEITYLDGIEEPVVETQAGWTIDGTSIKVRLDAGANLLDFRGLYRNPGP